MTTGDPIVRDGRLTVRRDGESRHRCAVGAEGRSRPLAPHLEGRQAQRRRDRVVRTGRRVLHLECREVAAADPTEDVGEAVARCQRVASPGVEDRPAEASDFT